MAAEPAWKRVVAFIDGQNLFYSAKEAFGYTYPNYDALKLASLICASGPGWKLENVLFYTGVPDSADNPKWSHFWAGKLAVMGKQGVHVFSRPLRYRHQTVRLPDGGAHTVLVGREKGVDVRIALDVVRLARLNRYDVCVIFSQDQDLTEAVKEIKSIARQQDRWVRVACAFPVSPASRNKRGIDKTDWIKITRAEYDQCIDHRDYRRK
jgi:uncharacterized LabA/DUF88 family protein